MMRDFGTAHISSWSLVMTGKPSLMAEKGIKVYKTFVGEYMTSLEMEGFSVSLLRLDDEMKALLDAHADTIAFKA